MKVEPANNLIHRPTHPSKVFTSSPPRPNNLPMQRIAAWLMCGCLAFLTLVASAAPPHFHVDVWRTAPGGLPQNSVIALTQTHDGYLWLGTLNGLVRFDGLRFTVFNEGNTPKLNSGRIVSLFEDSRQNLWLGTETAGAAVIHGGQVISLDIGRGNREGRVVAMCEDSTGAVWLYTGDGQLARHQNEKVDVWNSGPDRFSECRALIAEKSGQIWVGNDHAAFAINPSQVKAESPLPTSNNRSFRKLDFLLARKRGGYWQLADGSVQIWNGNQLEKTLAAYPWIAGGKVAAACEDHEGNLIVGISGQGVFWFDAQGQAIQISNNDGLYNNSILSLQVDSEANLWVGLDGGGLNQIKRQDFTLLPETAHLTMQSVAQDATGAIWFTSNDAGVQYLKDGTVHSFNSLINKFNVGPILVDRQQQVWVGTKPAFGDGLFQMSYGGFQVAPGNPVTGRKVYSLHQDRWGALWVGTPDGLAKWDGTNWTNFTMQQGLSANIVRAIADDADGNIWIGTERGGLNRQKDGHFTAYQQTNGFPSDNISSLYADADGVLWVGTFGNGLVRFQGGKWTHFTTRNGLMSDTINYFIDDGDGSFWIGSNVGLMRVPKKALTERGGFISCRVYGEADGLPNNECTVTAQPAACQTRDGKLWFPTISGLVSVDPKRIHANTNPPPVVIETVSLGGQEQNAVGPHGQPPAAITVPPGREFLEIQYTSLNLAAPDKARFKYRMQGYETDWIEAGNRREAPYTKLPPGEYVFQVTACNEDGLWNEIPSTLKVTVQPQFWQTKTFLGAVIIFLISLIVAVVHYISTQKLQRQVALLRQQEALERERARIARDIHDQLGASLTQVSLLGEMVESDKNVPEEVEAHGRQITQTARETAHVLDEIVWTVNPSNDTLEGLINYICKHAQEYLAVAGLRYRLEAPPQLPDATITPEARHNVFLAAKEAVTNIVRHAQATEAWIRLRVEPAGFTLEIEDNGRGLGGMDEKAAKLRNGLSNMRKRMEDIGGNFSMGTGTQGGTLVRLTAPIKRR